MNPRSLLRWAVLVAVVASAATACTLFGPGTTAVIQLSATSGTVPLTITFDGTGSTGRDGVSTYQWDFGDGTTSLDASGTQTFEHAGTFTVSLTVRGEDGRTAADSATVTVSPAFWVTDENLDQVMRLSLDGQLLDTFTLPAKEPRGVAIATVEGLSTLIVPCANEGFQRILYLDPATGALRNQEEAPAQSPLEITYGATGQKMLWHVDGLSGMIYRLSPESAQVYDSYGQSYFKATSPAVRDVPFLWKPQGLDWVERVNTPGYLWYLEGETRVLWKIRIIAGYDILSNTQLEIEGDGVPLDPGIFPVTAIDFFDGKLWAVDPDRHRIVELDPATGALTGASITGFPGSAPTGLEIQF
ncbi:MAG: PKD domain-containing protein [Candidatus Bipolaricaulota bacterium]